MDERFHYLFNDPVIKASSVLDPDTWPEVPEELATYGDDQQDGVLHAHALLVWGK